MIKSMSVSKSKKGVLENGVRVYEVRVYDEALSPRERRKIEKELMAEYGSKKDAR